MEFISLIDVQLADSGEYTIFLRNSSNQVHSVTKVNIVENLNKIKKNKSEGLFFYESKLVLYKFLKILFN
jgi:L-rhamnose mutarotase